MSKLNDGAEGDVLVAGDVLLVPKNESQILALGDVREPGLYSMPDGRELHLMEALAMAGGVDPNGDKKNVDIVRGIGEGEKPTVIPINTEALLKGSSGVTDATLQPGDIIYVQQRHQTKSVGDILNSITPLALVSSLARTGL
jgi:protein involved in polysaccharide export with SLBB domain